jgi:hypothetical protein
MPGVPIDVNELMLRSLRGATLHKLRQPAEGVWEFNFEVAGLTIECPWRLVSGGAVVLGGSDHGQRFGLPAPVDVSSETLRILVDLKVETVDANERTGDLRIRFNLDAQIDAFNNSGGYEGWNHSDHEGITVIATGGGSLAIWDKRGVGKNDSD